MEKTGGCLCGAVRYSATFANGDVGACHCGMCRKWSGGPYVSVHPTSVTFDAQATLKTYDSSAWAERGFCGDCGSALFYRLTAGPASGLTILAFGSLDDPTGMTLTHEVYTDKRPAAYAFAGELSGMTEAEVLARHGGG